ncbi:MAG: hypothetical protein ACTSPB_08735 [Candidatus Thorarchaeota archaeon]
MQRELNWPTLESQQPQFLFDLREQLDLPAFQRPTIIVYVPADDHAEVEELIDTFLDDCKHDVLGHIIVAEIA